MSSSCLALLLSLVAGCTLPGSPISIQISLPPQADLCVQYADHAPLCTSQLVTLLEAHALL